MLRTRQRRGIGGRNDRDRRKGRGAGQQPPSDDASSDRHHSRGTGHPEESSPRTVGGETIGGLLNSGHQQPVRQEPGGYRYQGRRHDRDKLRSRLVAGGGDPEYTEEPERHGNEPRAGTAQRSGEPSDDSRDNRCADCQRRLVASTEGGNGEVLEPGRCSFDDRTADRRQRRRDPGEKASEQLPHPDRHARSEQSGDPPPSSWVHGRLNAADRFIVPR